MSQEVKVGTILVQEFPGMAKFLELETKPYTGNWSLVKVVDNLALDRKIRAAGWNFFFLASETKTLFFGDLGTKKIQSALKRILGKVHKEHFNGIEVTGIVARRFLGVPYVTVSAHSRHMQPSCYLDGEEARRASQHDAEWATS